MNNYKLYVHICPNGKRYYGITSQRPARRWRNGKGYDHNEYFTRAINKYGWDNIEHIILFDSLTESEAKELEQYYIQWYQTADRDYGYNISLGGESGNCSDETKQKISKSNKGKHHTEESKQKMSESRKGTKHHMYGKHHTEETKQKLKESMMGKNGPSAKPVICITTKTVFYTAKDGAEYYSIDGSGIIKCCKDKRKSCGIYNDEKLVWKYINIIEL